MPSTLTVSDGLKGDLIQKRDKAECLHLVVEEMKCFLELASISYSSNQVGLWATEILKKYPQETVEDIALCFRRAGRGDFGGLFKTFDLGKFSEWMAVVLEEKAQAREIREQSKAKEEPWSDERYLEAIEAGKKINDFIAKRKLDIKIEEQKNRDAMAEYLRLKQIKDNRIQRKLEKKRGRD